MLLMPMRATGVTPDEIHHLTISEQRELTPREYLYANAGDDAETLDRLITCESGWKMIPNSTGASTAFGYAQFLDSTWRSTRKRMGLDQTLGSRENPTEHIDALIFLWDEGRGSAHWNESKFCWQRTLSVPR